MTVLHIRLFRLLWSVDTKKDLLLISLFAHLLNQRYSSEVIRKRKRQKVKSALFSFSSVLHYFRQNLRTQNSSAILFRRKQLICSCSIYGGDLFVWWVSDESARKGFFFGKDHKIRLTSEKKPLSVFRAINFQSFSSLFFVFHFCLKVYSKLLNC
jgi:hypothetical protein